MSKGKQPTDFNDFMDEFEIEVPMDTPPDPKVEVVLTEEEKAAEEAEAAAAKEAEEAERKRLEEEGKSEEEIEAELQAAKEAEAAEAAAAAEKEKETQNDDTPPAQTSYYSELAKKFIEKGKWDGNIEVDDGEGNVTTISELENIDEETFFQIEEAIEAQKEEDLKGTTVSTKGMNDRRKNLVSLIANGGDLAEIFKTEENVNAYVNRFDNVDLDNEEVQAKIYKEALMSHNKLSADMADVIVEKAKKDLTLDAKVQTYIEGYNKSFDEFVKKKEQELIDAKAEEKKKEKEFRKDLAAEYKKIELSDNLVKKLTSLATSKVDGEFEIDKKYAKMMEDPAQAAELVLFLTDKETYLKSKLKDGKIKVHKETRRKINLIPTGGKKGAAKKPEIGDNEFEINVKI